MKKLILLCLITLSLFAKKGDYLYEAAFLIGNSENGLNQNMDRSFAYQLQFQYNGFDFPIRPELSFVYSPDISLYTGGNTSYAALMANGVYEIPYSELVTPYVKAGVGYTSYDNVPESPSSGMYLDAGAGLKLHLTERLALKFQVLTAFNTEYFNLLATGGISFAFGQEDTNAAAVVTKDPQPVKEVAPVIIVKKDPQPVKEVTPVVIVKKDPKPLYVSFTFGRAQLVGESKASIKEYAQELNSDDNKDKHLFITAHTDNIGTRAFNATLSIKRASFVRAEFIANDVDPKRITIDAMGEVEPTATNETETGREKNRRAIIIVQDPQEP